MHDTSVGGRDGDEADGDRAGARGLFFGALWVASAVYLAAAFGLDFVTPNGTPAAGFFPRVIGLCLLGVLSFEVLLQGRESRVDHAAADTEVEVVALIKLGLLTIAFLLLTWLIGIIPASAALLFGGFRVLHPGTARAHMCLSVACAILLAIVFGVWFNMPLPSGLISRFF